MSKFKDARPELVPFLINVEDGEKSCGLTNTTKIKIKCPICGEINNKQVKTFVKNGLNELNCDYCNSFAKHYPDKVFFLKNKEDGLLPKGSHKKIECICPKCSSIKIMPIRDLWRANFTCKNCNSVRITNPEILKYLTNEEDSLLSFGSEKKIECLCPLCRIGRKSISMSSLVHGHFSCPVCSRGQSIPERFMFLLLTKLEISFVKEFSPIWFSDNVQRRYDFFIPSLETIIELHGSQHYKEFSGYYSNRLEEIQQNDSLKKEIANQNGILNYFIIDCSKSEKDFLTNSFKNNLETIINLENINFDEIWTEINIFSLVDIKEDYLNKKISIEEICEKHLISESTVINYAKKLELPPRKGNSSEKIIEIYNKNNKNTKQTAIELNLTPQTIRRHIREYNKKNTTSTTQNQSIKIIKPKEIE